MTKGHTAPSVSVIMPAFNVEKFVERSVQSVLSQTYVDLELIIVDDGSTDDTASIIRKLASTDKRIRLAFMAKNRGVARCRNRAIEMASGRYLAFLDSDDLWHSSKLEEHLKFMQRKGAAFSFTSYKVLGADGRDKGTRKAPKLVTYEELLRCCPIGCLTVMYDTDRVGKVYNSVMRKRQDWATWLAILKQCGVGYGYQKPLSVYQLRKNSLSANKLFLFKPIWHLYRVDQNLSFMSSARYCAVYAFNGLCRKFIPGFVNRKMFF